MTIENWDHEFMTVPEVARYLRSSEMTIYRLIRANELPAVQVGRRFLIRKTALESFLEDSRTDTR